MTEQKQYTLEELKERFYNEKYINIIESYKESFKMSVDYYINNNSRFYVTYENVHSKIKNISELTGIKYSNICEYAHTLQENIDLINGKMTSYSQDHLYFIETENAIKIGRSLDVYRRLQTLQSSNPDKLNIHFIKYSCGKYESALHRMFKYLNIQGEWFEKHKDLLGYIKLLKLHKNEIQDNYSPFHDYEKTNLIKYY